LKANKTCPGYRNQLDLSFRNETGGVIGKAKAKWRKYPPATRAKEDPAACVKRGPSRRSTAQISVSEILTKSVATGSSPETILVNYADLDDYSALYFNDSDVHNEAAVSISPSEWSTFSMFPALEELGTNVFLENFVAQHNGPSHGHFNYLHDMCRREQGMAFTLATSVVAAGLATYANTSKSPELMGQARRQYVVALRNINAALRSPVDAIKDSTLISIMVVSVFEAITGTNGLSLKAWTEHINGASTLLKLRGCSQIQTVTGLRMFIHVTSHLLVSCIQRELPMPQHLQNLRLEAFQLVPPDPAWQFLKVIDEFTIFRSSVKSGTLSDPETIISTALRYDGDLVRIFSNVPPEWLYETVSTDDDPDIVWNGCYDIYYDYWVAQIWNGMRSARIMLNETIRSRLLEGFTSVPPSFTTSEYTAQFQISTDVLVKMRDEILRSIPQHIGYVTRKPFAYSSQNSSPSRTPTPPFDGTSFTDLLEGTASFSEHSSPQSSLMSRSTPPPTQTSALKQQHRTSPRTSPPRTSPPPSTHLSNTPTQLVPLSSTSSLPTSSTFTPTPQTPSIGGYFLLWPLYACGSTRVSTPASRSSVLRHLRYIGNTMGIMQGNALANFLSMGGAGMGTGMQGGMRDGEGEGLHGGREKGGEVGMGGFRLGRRLDS
jgi:hypothetical protein